MKLTMKLILIISLFSSVALAEGDMDGGTLSGDMDGGTVKCEKCGTDAHKDYEDDSIVDFIQTYLFKLLG